MKTFISKKSFFAFFCLVIIIFHFLQILYFERSFFINKYDIAYWKDRYEHSQYQLPLSKRIIGDDGLFAYAGYRLVQGDAPFSINVDKPPAGKYLIGLSILLFKNPAHYALFFGLGSLVILFFIAKKLFKKITSIFFVITALFLDPLFFSQLWKPWLDITQLFLLLLNILLMSYIQDRGKRIMFALFAGASLGLFMEIKPPILFPIIFLLEAVFFIYNRFLKGLLFFTSGIILGACVSYIYYFHLGNGIIDILKLHKFMTSFYLASELQVHIGSIWQALLLGRFPDIATGVPIQIEEWSLLWPIISVVGISLPLLYIVSKTFHPILRGISMFVLISLLVYTFIPAYPRYLILIIPFLYLLFTYAVEQLVKNRIRMVLFLIILIYSIAHATLFLLPSPDGLLRTFSYSFSHQYFQDVYQENLSKKSKSLLTREEFRYITQKVFEQATVKAIKMEEIERNVSKWRDNGWIKYRIIYKTQDLGQFQEIKTIQLVKEDSQWKIKWDWDILFNNFLPNYSIKTEVFLGKRGRIIDVKGKTLVEDASGYLVLVNPEEIDTKREEEMLKLMEGYSYKAAVNLQNAYHENTLPGEYVPLFTLHKALNNKEENKLLSYPGVRLTKYPSRIYKGLDSRDIKNTFYEECCTRIYSSYNYHGVIGTEKGHDDMLFGYSGGKIAIIDKKDHIVRTILKKISKDGGDIQL